MAAGMLLIAARKNRAQSDEMNIQFHTFQDTRTTTILSPAIDLAKDFTERTSLRMSYGLDAISAASDSCARCHHNGANTHRQVFGLSVTQSFNDWKLTLGGDYSQENFYRATTFLTSMTRDLAKGNTTVAGGYTFSLNQPTLHPTPDIENQYQHDGYASVTQTLTKTTIAQAGIELASLTGYLDNPYLRANVNGVMLLGRVPDARLRRTFSARIRQALPADTFVEADYRRYGDDWELSSNTLSLGVSHDFTPMVYARFNYRLYDQTGAYFYQPYYVGPVPEYFTADFRLSPFTSGLYTGTVVIAPKKSWFGLPANTALTLQYERYTANNGFQAGIFSTGLRIPF
jgi:hypothetical protein